MMFGSGESFDYLECGACASLRISEIPHDLGHYYPAGYYSFERPHIERRLKLAALRLRTRLWLTSSPALRRPGWPWMPSQLPSWLEDLGLDDPILDVGSGGGAELAFLYRWGFRNLLGVDPYLDVDIEVRRGFRLQRAELTAVSGTFGLITLNHSLEHVPHPVETLVQVRERLAPHGRVVVSTPVMGKAAWREFGVGWIQLDPPRHLTIFTESGMAAAAAKAGLEVSDIQYNSKAFQFWGSELAKRSIPLVTGPDTTFSSDEMLDFSYRAKMLNRRNDGDQAAFLLRMSDRPAAKDISEFGTDPA